MITLALAAVSSACSVDGDAAHAPDAPQTTADDGAFIATSSLAATSYVSAYFVDSTAGNDANTGLSEAAPWKSLAKVSAEFRRGSFKPGDAVLLRRGAVFKVAKASDRLNVAGSSGRLGSPITIGDYGTGAKPKIRYAGAGGLLYLVGRSAGDPAAEHILIKNLEIDGSLGEHQMWVRGTRYWTLTGLYLHDARRFDSGSSDGSVAAASFRDNAKRIIVDNCLIERSEGEGLKIGRPFRDDDRTGEMVVTNSTFRDNSYEAIDLKDGATNVFVFNNVFEDNGDGGQGTGDVTQFSVGGQRNLVYFNRFSGAVVGNASTIQLGRYNNSSSPYSGQNNVVERCLFEGITSERVISLKFTNNRIIHNTFVDSMQPITTSDVNKGVVRDNLFASYPNSAIRGTSGVTIAYNGFSGAAQGSNAINGSVAFANRADFALASGSKFAGKASDGRDLGWAQNGWALDDYRKDFSAKVAALNPDNNDLQRFATAAVH